MEAVEIAGTVVFAISGVIAVAARPLDWFGAIVVGVVTALGGGTMRGLILGVTPVFWIEDHLFLITATAGALIAVPVVHAIGHASAKRLEESLKLVDAAGLALFAIVGSAIAIDLGFGAATAVVSGLVTGVGGGVIRDILAGRTPLIMRGEIYATTALFGAVVFVVLFDLTPVSEPLAGVVGGVAIFALRVLAIRGDWSLPPLTRGA
jgi:uncharacterized membrane protein YeiH